MILNILSAIDFLNSQETKLYNKMPRRRKHTSICVLISCECKSKKVQMMSKNTFYDFLKLNNPYNDRPILIKEQK